jgi:hypothetical protein
MERKLMLTLVTATAAALEHGEMDRHAVLIGRIMRPPKPFEPGKIAGRKSAVTISGRPSA